jgi:hypothetical protein
LADSIGLQWHELEKRARSEGVAVHALVRKAILALLRRAA